MAFLKMKCVSEIRFLLTCIKIVRVSLIFLKMTSLEEQMDGFVFLLYSELVYLINNCFVEEDELCLKSI